MKRDTAGQDAFLRDLSFDSIISEKQAGEYAVHYESRNHLAVLFQLHGSAWPRVFKYCVANVLLTLLCHYCIYPYINHLGFEVTAQGHTLSNVIVSFFVVSRCTMALSIYNESLGNLSKLLSSTREIVSAIVGTLHESHFILLYCTLNTISSTQNIATKNDQSVKAKEWRNEVAYYTCLLLRLAIAVLSYEDDNGTTPWQIPELQGDIKEKLLHHNHITGEPPRWAYAKRTEREEVYRTPTTMSFYLRMAIADQKKYLEKEVNPLSMTRFNGLVDGFMQAYYSQMRSFVAPIPFPLLQIARTLNFLW